ncbi:hypothetical protein C2S52_006394 [Perilla frutescens var. hirtella]|nr:hypothetical protein C2S51_009410 [Perilla frutescens var. frutescens]KAH6786842.1 hypothetical protein C2S52_006394 [Perilla frutescens var. hirtella]
MHHLSTVSDHPAAAAASSASLDTCTVACGNSAKRQSPLSRSLLQEPMPKRATLHPPSSPSTDHDLFGFTKLPLPQAFPAASPPLRRTLSEPIYSPVTVNSAAPPPQVSEFPNSPNPIKTLPRQEISSRNVSQESFPIPETAPALAPLLYRTVSDPNPVFNRQLVAAAGTPPRPPRNLSRSPSCGESPSAKRLKRMKERLREMSHWWTQVASEDDDEENVESETYCIDNDPKNMSGSNSGGGMGGGLGWGLRITEWKDIPVELLLMILSLVDDQTVIVASGVQEESETVVENPSQEAVFVEKTGDCLVLHFKCPCGDGYQILLSGSNCYYKLTNFRN